MSELSPLARLVGEWTGTNKLWVEPGSPARESDATATIGTAGQGRFVTLAYAWADGGQPQDGLLVIGYEESRERATAYWLDSWHMNDKVMVCEGTIGEDGAVEIAGSYEAPPGPDWGWTIRLEPGDDRTVRMLMHNVTPDGESALAVEATFSAASAAGTRGAT